MKRNLLFWIAGLFILASCQDDNSSNTPNELVSKAFYAKYPSATQVTWETRNSYMTADFVNNQQANTAWFNYSGQWYMTETELKSTDELPESVRTALANSEYADWTIDDLDRLDRLDREMLYVIEVKKGNLEYDLYYSEEGILIKSIADDDQDDFEDLLPDHTPLPAVVTEFINTRYPAARIVEIEREYHVLEVDIIHENRSKEIEFNVNNEWIGTHYDVHQNEIENKVLQTLQASDYKDYSIDDIEKYETSAGDYYLFELEKGEHEINIKIDTEGNLSLS